MSNETGSVIDFERYPAEMPRDETDVSLRAYISRISPDKLARYQRDWSDAEVMAWDGNFRSDGCLMLVCCERDVDIGEFRRVLQEYVQWNSMNKGA